MNKKLTKKTAGTYPLGDIVKMQIPRNLPLSLFTVGYEKDAYPGYNFPTDVTKGLTGSYDMDYLINLQKNLNANINTKCEPGQGEK